MVWNYMMIYMTCYYESMFVMESRREGVIAYNYS